MTKYIISENHYKYFCDLKSEENLSVKDGYLLQVAAVSGNFVILHVQDFFEEEGSFYMIAEVKEVFNSEQEAKSCIKKMKEAYREVLKK